MARSAKKLAKNYGIKMAQAADTRQRNAGERVSPEGFHHHCNHWPNTVSHARRSFSCSNPGRLRNEASRGRLARGAPPLGRGIIFHLSPSHRICPFDLLARSLPNKQLLRSAAPIGLPSHHC